ncbi:hypothetical protein BKA67DRAFT_260300 [Truncatella angustata]|uniref:Uncharacterized protein n=1 Tax=Truncatella angustata TaxID=152316 RepID=A0A9P8UKG5_9PEZI|nr:uncharacterized protein BKA67DRAFT_260300 [Truncatella angustata]KAH6653769.1 hypothetical protein BKA67DRAFT_260300 [Truncatella angustata]
MSLLSPKLTSSDVSSTIEGMASNMDNATFVIVTGLRGTDDPGKASTAVPEPLFWVSGGLLMTQSPKCHCIEFRPDFSTKSIENLSPELLDSMARNLLDFVSRTERAVDGTNRLVFVCEDLGGIIVKKALTLAETTSRYAGLVRDTCACVFYGVPHQASPLQSWTEAVAEIISFWKPLPQGRWKPTASLSKFLRRTSFEFIPAAFRLTVVSIFERDIERENMTVVGDRPVKEYKLN